MSPTGTPTFSDRDWDAPHWIRRYPELCKGTCEHCLYGDPDGCRDGLVACLLWSTPQTRLLRLTGERCHAWEEGRS